MNAAMKESKSKDKHPDAIAMLTEDHSKVKGLFEEFEKLKSNGDAAGTDKAALVAQICQELTLHAELEEQIFYPAARDVLEEDDLMDEAEVEHACAKDLIAQLQEMDPADDLYDAKVTVLGEQIKHHVKEEEGEMFAQAKKSSLDTKSLGEQMSRQKAELMESMGMSSDEEDEAESDDHPTSAAKKKRAASHRR